jgi:hypothetical protein
MRSRPLARLAVTIWARLLTSVRGWDLGHATGRPWRLCLRGLVVGAAGAMLVAGPAAASPARAVTASLATPGRGSSSTTQSALPGYRSRGGLQCDVYSQYGTPCVAAYSMARALYASYDGPQYQVQRASDGAKVTIGLLQRVPSSRWRSHNSRARKKTVSSRASSTAEHVTTEST